MGVVQMAARTATVDIFCFLNTAIHSCTTNIRHFSLVKVTENQNSTVQRMNGKKCEEMCEGTEGLEKGA
jgi:hypothetical protein